MDKSYQAKTGEVKREWYFVDANEQILGRLASQIARVLMGKNKPQYTAHIDVGDYVVVVNAEKIKVTGKKAEYSKYPRYSGYQSGLKIISFQRMMERKPGEILRLAVQRMMPKNKLASQMMKKLKIYVGNEHPHEAQGVQPFPFDKI